MVSMEGFSTFRNSVVSNGSVKRWVSRAFILSILAYLVVIGYLLAESVSGASKWAPYGVNMPAFVGLIVASEVIVALSAAWIFKEDAGIWPASIAQGWRRVQAGAVLPGLGQIAGGAWDISIVDLRLRTPRAILLGRVNRLAALAPLAYALAASAGGAPWGLRSSALVDVAITVAVWAFMEAVMVQPQGSMAAPVRVIDAKPLVRSAKTSRYEIRQVRFDDMERIEEIERIKWRDQAATTDMIRSRLGAFPQGQRAAVHVSSVDGREVRRAVVAWCTIMPASGEQVRSFRSWDRVTSSGTIRDCDERGDVLVGVNLTSVTEGATYLLLGEILASVVEWGKTKLIGGGRLTGFVAFNEHRAHDGKRPFTPDEYVRLRELRGFHINERRIDEGAPPLTDDEYVRIVNNEHAMNGDPLLDEDERPDYVCSNVRGYMSIPGAVMVEVVPGYFKDEASDDYGVVMEWENPLPRLLRRVGPIRAYAAGRVRREVRAEWEQRKERLHNNTRRRIAVSAAASRSTEAKATDPERSGAEVPS